MASRRQISPKERLQILKVTDPAAYERAVAVARQRAYKPTPAQVPILKSKARYRLVRAGRRFGKTKTAARAILRASRKPGSMNWWVANTYKNVRRGYKEVLRQLPPSMLAKPAPPATANDLILHLKNGATIEFYSAGNPDAMAGEGVAFLVADEAALWPNGQDVWNQTLRPTLADSRGHVLFISTPRGRNWFWQIDKRGQDPDYPDYDSWHYTMRDNPYISPTEVDDLEDSLPEIVFQQEILAEYVADAASIFKVPDNAIIQGLAEARGQIVMGVDLARKNDFTVLTAARSEDRMPVYHERFKDRRWTDQRELIRAAVSELHHIPDVEDVIVVVDSTGVGDVVVEDLEEDGLDVTGIKFSNTWKTQAVKQLAADLERGRAFIPAPAASEFDTYEYNLTPAGNYQFSAPEGLHDDQVSAKLLEHWAMHDMTSGIGGIRLMNPYGVLLDPDDVGDPDDPDDYEEEEPVTILVPDSPESIAANPSAWH